jgi:hypothetical protein
MAMKLAEDFLKLPEPLFKGLIASTGTPSVEAFLLPAVAGNWSNGRQ